MKRYSGSEQQIQNSIIEGLQYRGFYAQRVNSGAIKTANGDWVKLFPKGTPDILAIRHGQAWWFEVKKVGKKSEGIQLAVQAHLMGAGCKVYEVHSWEEVQEAINE
jgi:hypothetical protein